MNPVPHRSRLVTAPPSPDRGTTSWGTDPYAEALRNGHGPLFLRCTDGWLLPWTSNAGARKPTPPTCRHWAAAKAPFWTSAAGPAGWSPSSPSAAIAHSASTSARPPSPTRFDSAERRCTAPSSTRCRARAAGAPPCSSTVTSASAGTHRSSCTARPTCSPRVVCSSPRRHHRTSTRNSRSGWTTDAAQRPPTPAPAAPRPPHRSPGPGSAHRPCCGTRRRTDGSPSISGRRTAAPSCPCAATGRYGRRATVPSPRTATP